MYLHSIFITEEGFQSQEWIIFHLVYKKYCFLKLYCRPPYYYYYSCKCRFNLSWTFLKIVIVGLCSHVSPWWRPNRWEYSSPFWVNVYNFYNPLFKIFFINIVQIPFSVSCASVFFHFISCFQTFSVIFHWSICVI